MKHHLSSSVVNFGRAGGKLRALSHFALFALAVRGSALRFLGMQAGLDLYPVVAYARWWREAI